jgi:hypothetical protein
MSKATSILRWVYGLFYVYVGTAWFSWKILATPLHSCRVGG